MAISTNQKPTIYRKLYENTDPGFNSSNAEIFLYKSWKPKCFFQFEILIIVSVGSASLKYLSYRCTAIINVLIISVCMRPSLDVYRFWRLKSLPSGLKFCNISENKERWNQTELVKQIYLNDNNLT